MSETVTVKIAADTADVAAALKAANEKIAELEAEVERLRTAGSFERADWYWDIDDPEYTSDTASELLWDVCSPLEIMGVAGAFAAGERWGFFTNDEESDEQTYHWFKTKAEAEAARDALKPQGELSLGGREASNV